MILEDDDGALTFTHDAEPRPPLTEYIGGPAGTGKTYLVRERAQRTRGQVLCATTGIAAVNLGPDVSTINSYLGYYDTASLHDAWSAGYLSSRIMRHVREGGLRQIVLDEVSMLDGEQLTIFSALLEELNERLEGQNVQIGMTLTGDFCQLPPVKAKFAFEVEAWKPFEDHTTILSKFYRQTDPQFLAALQDARQGNGSRAAEYFEPYFVVEQDRDYDGSTILAKNDQVDRFNLLRLSKLGGAPIVWRSERWGKPKGEWKLIPEQLKLKEGALVMLLANAREYDEVTGQAGPLIYANGDLAELLNDEGQVKLRRNGQTVPVVPVTRKNLQIPEPGRRKEYKAETGRELLLVCGNLGCKNCQEERGCCPDAKYEVVGEITYMPLRAAWATTCHKTQGLTLERCQLDIRDRFFESPGMTYVGLSRVKEPKGLRIVGTPEQFVRRCRIDPKVRRWL